MTVIDDLSQWSPEAKARLLAAIQDREHSTWKPFFCPNPRCTGRPHDDGTWQHEHARADQRLPKWNDDWLTLLWSSGRGTGKALSLDTPLVTPTGWTTMGDVQEGDYVISGEGQPTLVTFATEVQYGRDCYRVTLSDGTELIADAEHQWVTSTHQQRKQAYRNDRDPETSTVTTLEILDTLTYGKRGDLNHCIWLTDGLDLPDSDLPIDPYTLGVWLGDGASAAGAVTISDDDVEEMREYLAEELGRPYPRKPGTRCATYPLGVVPHLRDENHHFVQGGMSLFSRLDRLGLIKNKHIPALYLRASHEQRLALLQGLMDSDGYANNKSNTVEFTSTKRELAEDVHELALSLGQKATIREGVATLYGREIGPKWRVCFRPSTAVFRLRRKAGRLNPDVGQGQRSRHRMIVSIERVDTVPVKCISVDAPSRTYLAGEQMVVTHNTRGASEIVNRIVKKVPEIALVGATGPAVREVMIEGPTGILATAPPGFRPKWEPSRKLLTWPNGAIAHGVSAEEPDRIRGLNVGFAWLDEAAFMALITEVWSNLRLALRIGSNPHILVTTTPRPTKWIKELIANDKTITRRVSTYENLHNLSPVFREQILSEFEGTRMGRQELYGEVLEDVEGSLWKPEMFQYISEDKLPEMDRIVVAVDPAGSANARSDETGIIVIGRSKKSLYVLADLSGKYSPARWAEVAQTAHEDYRADAIIAEKNYGGDMVRHTLETSAKGDARVVLVDSRRGKAIRAEPVVGMYERNQVWHVAGSNRADLAKLETEQVEWIPGVGASPNRVDALVHGATNLYRSTGGPASIASPAVLLKNRRLPTTTYRR